MKARESGMPDENIWEHYFDVDTILEELEINNEIENLIDLGFGHGTFSIPASKRIKGNVIGYDIETELVHKLESKLKINNIQNVHPFKRDFISDGTGLQNESADYVMLFNILHSERSIDILKETFRILKNNGKVGVIHWNYDPSTPRGPSMPIRPKPHDLKKLLLQSHFTILKYNLNLPPYHYGILARK